jgi:hypothetical protein
MQYRPAQLRTKNIHGILTMFMSIVTISHLLSNGQNNPIKLL